LKHHEIARFSERHGASMEWLLEGRGRGRCELMDILDGTAAQAGYPSYLAIGRPLRRHTLAGCSDNNWRGLSRPRCLL
jgi:hypothetical protein